MSANSNRPIIIKKVKKVAGGHHGGAWKVAYADFVTAMMAFFLLMWLINTTSPEQKRGIADYFAPASLSATTSGAGGILAGTALGESGAMQQGSTAVTDDKATPNANGETSGSTGEDSEASQQENAEFQQAEISLRQALQDLPELAQLSNNIIVDQTKEGLRIQLVDQEGRPMFEPGSTEPNDRAKALLRAASRVIMQLPNQIIIYGHTDASPNTDPNNSNWEISTARANAARRVLESTGIPDERVSQIAGKAGTEPLFPDDPYQPANRRIAIVLKRASPPLPGNPSL